MTPNEVAKAKRLLNEFKASHPDLVEEAERNIARHHAAICSLNLEAGVRWMELTAIYPDAPTGELLALMPPDLAKVVEDHYARWLQAVLGNSPATPAPALN